MTSIFAISYTIDNNNPAVHFAGISNDMLSQKNNFSEVSNDMFKQLIHDELHNSQNCELEGRCRVCLGYEDRDDKLFNSIKILSVSKII